MSTQVMCGETSQLKLPPCKLLMQESIQVNSHGMPELSQPHKDYMPAGKYPCAPFAPELRRLSPLSKRRYLNGSANGSASPTYPQPAPLPSGPLRGANGRYEASPTPYDCKQGYYQQYIGSPQPGNQQLSSSFCSESTTTTSENLFRRGSEYPPSSSSKFILPSPTVRSSSMSRRDSQSEGLEGFASTTNGITAYGKSFSLDGGDTNSNGRTANLLPMTPMTEMSEEMSAIDDYCVTNGHRGRNMLDGYLEESMVGNEHPNRRVPFRSVQNPPQQHHRYYSSGGGSSRNTGDTAMTKLERRRKAHLDSEKRRRGNIKNGMDELMCLIPGCSTSNGNANPSSQDGKANSKAIVLRKAKDYIIQLLKKIDEQERENERVMHQYNKAQLEKEHFQRENERLLAMQRDYRCTL